MTPESTAARASSEWKHFKTLHGITRERAHLWTSDDLVKLFEDEIQGEDKKGQDDDDVLEEEEQGRAAQEGGDSDPDFASCASAADWEVFQDALETRPAVLMALRQEHGIRDVDLVELGSDELVPHIAGRARCYAALPKKALLSGPDREKAIQACKREQEKLTGLEI